MALKKNVYVFLLIVASFLRQRIHTIGNIWIVLTSAWLICTIYKKFNDVSSSWLEIYDNFVLSNEPFSSTTAIKSDPSLVRSL